MTAHIDAPTAGGVTVAKPDRGVAVLACRCGRMLNTADMRWAPPPPPDVIRPIPSIVCGVCRNQALT